MPYDESLINKYRAVDRGVSDPSRTPAERESAKKIRAKMEEKYPGIADEARLREAPRAGGRGGAGGGGGGFPGGVYPGAPGFDWSAFIGAGVATFMEFLKKLDADLDQVNDSSEIKQIVEQVQVKKRIDRKNGQVNLLFCFDVRDLEDLLSSDDAFNVGAEHFGEIAEAAFRNAFGAK